MRDEDFRKLLEEMGISLHSDKLLNVLKSKTMICNIPLKRKRMAQIIIPRENTIGDIELIISHLKLIKKSIQLVPIFLNFLI